MKKGINEYKNKLLPKIETLRVDEIIRLAKKANMNTEYLLKVLTENSKENCDTILNKKTNKTNNVAIKKILVELYGNSTVNDQKLIIESLLKVGAFDDYMLEHTIIKKQTEQLWPLLMGLSSKQLSNLLELDEAEFNKKLKLAISTTKHWK